MRKEKRGIRKRKNSRRKRTNVQKKGNGRIKGKEN